MESRRIWESLGKEDAGMCPDECLDGLYEGTEVDQGWVKVKDVVV